MLFVYIFKNNACNATKQHKYNCYLEFSLTSWFVATCITMFGSNPPPKKKKKNKVIQIPKQNNIQFIEYDLLLI